MLKRIKIGDVIEMQTAKGLSYAQLSHIHPRYGALIRILSGFFKSRPVELFKLINEPESFVVFFPLQAGVNRKLVKIVDNAPVPDAAKPFPLFKAGIPDPVTGKIEVWWLWDGNKEWKIGQLKPGQSILPSRGVWNYSLLIERIESGWTPADDSS
jgi:hypothetical protein